VKLKTTAEHLVSLLAAHGVEYLFLNPGTDTAPVQEAVYSLAEAGLPAPTVLPSTFESVSLAAAHAYWNMTGRPQAVFVHVDAGTQNLGAMVHNVLRGRAGVIVIAGKTPYGEEDGPSGGRNRPIQWQQDVPDQPGIVRGYAKWIQEITRPEMLDRAIGRAVQVAASSPAGMAYLTVSRDVLMDPPRLDHSRVSGFAVPVPPAADKGAVARISPNVDPATHTLSIRCAVKNPGLRLKPQMLARIKIVTSSGSALIVPQDALVFDTDCYYAFVLAPGNVIVRREVAIRS